MHIKLKFVFVKRKKITHLLNVKLHPLENVTDIHI